MKYIEENQLSVTAGELAETYPYINDILPGLQEKYGFSSKTYTILAPEKIEDILEEGQALHHCIGKEEQGGPDRVLCRNAEKESKNQWRTF